MDDGDWILTIFTLLMAFWIGYVGLFMFLNHEDNIIKDNTCKILNLGSYNAGLSVKCELIKNSLENKYITRLFKNNTIVIYFNTSNFFMET